MICVQSSVFNNSTASGMMPFHVVHQWSFRWIQASLRAACFQSDTLFCKQDFPSVICSESGWFDATWYGHVDVCMVLSRTFWSTVDFCHFSCLLAAPCIVMTAINLLLPGMVI